jgi:hypothetical protein
MKSPILVRLAVLVVVMVGVAAGAVTGLLFVTRSKTAQSAVIVLQKAQAVQSETLAVLGPNTTLHGIGTDYREQPDAGGLPNTTVSESFWTFDAAGKLSAYSNAVRGTDGHVYHHIDMVGGVNVYTDVKSGRTTAEPGFDAATADSLRAVQSRVITALLARVTPSVMTKAATVNGAAVFIIDTPDGHGGTNRDYIRQSDYWPVRSEELAPDGHITSYTTQTVLEVLSNGPSIAVGAPSLVSGNVNVPIMTTGAVANAYSGVNVHLRWNPAVFSFSSANASGSVLSSPICPSAADSDGGGVTVGCVTVGSATTAVSGLVLTIILTPKTGCSALHLFTFAGADGGDQHDRFGEHAPAIQRVRGRYSECERTEMLKYTP